MAAEQISWRVGGEAGAAAGVAPAQHGGTPVAGGAVQFQFQFISIEGGDGIGSAAARKKARAYVAKESHARLRRERVLQYQESKRRRAQYQHAPGISTGPGSSQGSSGPTTRVIRQMSPRTLLSAAPMDPFDSAARPMSSLEHCFLLHYIDTVLPASKSLAFPFLDDSLYSEMVLRDWIPLALADPDLMNGIFVPVCRSLHALCGGRGPYLEAALAYKLSCIRSIRRDIADKTTEPRTSTIGKAMLIGGDEATIGNIISSRDHIEAAMEMVALRGGISALEGNRYLQGLVGQVSNYAGAVSEASTLFTKFSHFRPDLGPEDLAEKLEEWKICFPNGPSPP